ncbi:MAG: hypothetical protein ACTHLX_21905 [Candidatus Binatia bacterium]
MVATQDEEAVAIHSAAGLIIAVTEQRNWIEVFFQGDLMHTRTVNFPSDRMFDIYVEEIPHKTTVYEHPRRMIFFTGPYDLQIARDGDRVVVTGAATRQTLA